MFPVQHKKHTKIELVACNIVNVVLALTALFLTSSFKTIILPTTVPLSGQGEGYRACHVEQ